MSVKFKARSPQDKTQRVSISLPSSLLKDIDEITIQRGFDSRSRAVSEMVRRSIAEHHAHQEQAIVAGTISVVYDITRNKCQGRIAQLQRNYLSEVISSLHVQLEDNHTMEVMIVQGPSGTLRKIADEITSCKGVKTGQLTLTSVIIPPVHTPQRT